MSNLTRRSAASVLTAAAATRVLGANDRVRAAVIGSGGRGQFLTGEFKEVGVEMSGVCDIYEPNQQAGLKIASTGAKPFNDYRRVLDDKSFDAVIVSTPDHWHARMTIDAVEAGKDVYVEKPLAHTIDEGFAIIEAVRRTKRIVQVGTQRRSFDVFLEARKSCTPALLGPVRLVTSSWMNHQATLSDKKLTGNLDWKQWLGTAPKRDLDAQRFFNWYYFWDYSGGLLIGQAAHIIDAIHWFLDLGQPTAVTCVGSKPNIPGAEVPETASLTVEYGNNTLVNFVIGYHAMRYAGFNDQIKMFHGSKARLDVGREGFALFPESRDVEMKPSAELKKPGSFRYATAQHIRNFIDCIRTRKEPNAPVEAGQATNIVLCLAMDSVRKNRRLAWDAERRKVTG